MKNLNAKKFLPIIFLAIMNLQISTAQSNNINIRKESRQHSHIDETDSLPSIKYLLPHAVVSEGNQARLQSAFAKAKKGGKLVIGVIGGSITEGSVSRDPDKRYANVVLSWWRKTFPNTEIVLVNAGIGATGTNYGAMRVKRDLLSKSPDMVIIEFAVNDLNTKEDAESYEGVVRQILNAPEKPAVMLLFMTRKNGITAQELESRIGAHYGLPMISYRDALWTEIESDRLKWEQISFDVVHPNENGHVITGELISGFLEEAFKKLSAETPLKVNKKIPPPLFTDDFEFTSLFDGEDLKPLTNKNWEFEKSNKAGWKSSAPGSVIEFEICGTRIYLSCWKINGPMGKIKVNVDGRNPVIVDAWFNETWGGMRYMVPIGENLRKGKHTVRIELLQEKNSRSTGNEFKVLCLGSAGVK
jgi:lysophospholipase L1-like esterase